MCHNHNSMEEITVNKGVRCMNVPTFTDVLRARRQISPYLRRTPLYSYPALNALIGTEVHIKDDWTPVKIGE